MWKIGTDRMDAAKKNFDEFTWQTRVMPVIVVAIPLFLAAVAKGFTFPSLPETGFMVVIIVAVLSLLYRLGRNLGKKCEAHMVSRLGAMPTTILLRFSDSRISTVSKQHYHQRINEVYALHLPLEPAAERPEDDEQYDAAARSLKNRANFDRSTEFRVYQELKEYHYFRNLHGIKPIAIIIYAVLAVREMMLIPNFNLKALFLTPMPDYLSFAMFLFAIVLCCLVTAKAVEERAFSYAIALIETCERI